MITVEPLINATPRQTGRRGLCRCSGINIIEIQGKKMLKSIKALTSSVQMTQHNDFTDAGYRSTILLTSQIALISSQY